MFLQSTQNQRCFNVKFRGWLNVDKLTLIRRWNAVVFSTLIKSFDFSSIVIKKKIVFYSKPKINVVATFNFDVDLTLINWRCLDVEIWLSFQLWDKDFNFSSFMIKEQNFVLGSTQSQRCLNIKFKPWFDIDKLT